MKTTALLVTLLLASTTLVVAAAAGPGYTGCTGTVVIHSDGVVEALIEANVEPGLNQLPAPAPPVPASIQALVNGRLVPVVYDNGSIYVASEEPGRAVVTYLVNVTGAEQGLRFQLLNTTVRLVVEPGIVLLDLPPGILNVSQVNQSLVLLVKGPAWISYIVAGAPGKPAGGKSEAAGAATTTTATATTASPATTPAVTTTGEPQATATTTTRQPEAVGEKEATVSSTTATQPMQASQTSTRQASTQQPTQGTEEARAGGEKGGTPLLPILAAAALAIGAAMFFLRRRPSPTARGAGEDEVVLEEGLDDVDMLILKKLEEHGGEMLQSQLLRETGLPKTTLWRHVRRLEERGYIQVVRRGRSNLLRLIRRPH